MRQKWMILFLFSFLLNFQNNLLGQSRTIYFKNITDSVTLNAIRKSFELSVEDYKKLFLMMKDSIMKEEQINDEEFKEELESKLDEYELRKAYYAPKEFDFFVFRAGDSLIKKKNVYVGRPFYTEIIDITTFRKHTIDSVYNKGKLRIDTSSLSFNINNNPDAVVDYSISFKDSSRNILGYDCVLIEIIEKKLFKTFTQELIKEVNQYKIFATKRIQPTIPVIGSQFLFKNILPDYTPLYVSMFREDKRVFQIEAIKIAN